MLKRGNIGLARLLVTVYNAGPQGISTYSLLRQLGSTHHGQAFLKRAERENRPSVCEVKQKCVLMLHSAYSSSPAAPAVVVVVSALVEFIVPLAAKVLAQDQLAVLHQLIPWYRFTSHSGERIQKTQAHTTSKRLPLYFYVLRQ